MGMGSKKKNEAAAAASGGEASATGLGEPASTTPATPPAQEPPAQEPADVTPAPTDQASAPDQQSLDQQGQDATDAAGIGSAHGDEPTDPASDEVPGTADPIDGVSTLDVQILSIAEPAGEVMDEIQSERLSLELRLDELGDPIARRNTIAAVIAEETANWKAAERQHRDRMGLLRQSLNEEFERGQEQLEEIRLANIRLDQLKVLAEQKAAAIAEAARLAAVTPAAPAGADA